jgi:hypothetical protein
MVPGHSPSIQALSPWLPLAVSELQLAQQLGVESWGSLWPKGPQMPQADYPCPHLQYGIVLDAGSSHTSMFVYKWPADKENDTGIVGQHSSCDVQGERRPPQQEPDCPIPCGGLRVPDLP